MNRRSKVVEALVLILAVAVVARVVWELLGPLLPALFVIVAMASLLFGLLRRQ